MAYLRKNKMKLPLADLRWGDFVGDGRMKSNLTVFIFIELNHYIRMVA